MVDTWFTSDFHLGHANVIKFDNRPFDSIKDMDDSIIDNINSVVKPKDTLYFLGDFCYWKMSSLQYANSLTAYRRRIACNNIIYIYGNHDKELRSNIQLQRYNFKEFHTLLETKICGQDISLCHYSMEVWDKAHHGAWCLFGHSHGSLPDDPNALKIDVGINCHGYYPLHFEEVKQKMSSKKFVPLDHHGVR